MKFDIQYPRHPLLQQHIRYYYFVRIDNTRHHSCYHSFPNTTIPVNIHKNVVHHISGNKVCVAGVNKNNYTTIVNGLRERPLCVDWKGIIDKVTIAFNLPGINHFIKRDLAETINGFSNIFTEWENEAYTRMLDNFYKSVDPSAKLSILEAFLLSIYRSFDKAPTLEKSLSLLSEFDQEMTIAEIAGELNISERTLNRLFKTHVGVAPVAYRKIARFRQSLENKVVKEKFKRLTDISYESNYYDQSYFIKMYNKLSGKSPKDLYNSVNKFADDNVIFEFLENTIDFG